MKTLRNCLLFTGVGAVAGLIISADYKPSNIKEISSIYEIDYDKAFKRDVDLDGIEDVIINKGSKDEYAIDGRVFMKLKEDGYSFEDGLWRKR